MKNLRKHAFFQENDTWSHLHSTRALFGTNGTFWYLERAAGSQVVRHLRGSQIFKIKDKHRNNCSVYCVQLRGTNNVFLTCLTIKNKKLAGLVKFLWEMMYSFWREVIHLK